MENTESNHAKPVPIPDQIELDLKITKIQSMVETVNRRIGIHEQRLEKLNHVQDQRSTRDKISRLTRSILENT
ncbi:MAG: hypothetical protein AABZ14_08715 [Candidatus Margulisiibacteriota bacterium]